LLFEGGRRRGGGQVVDRADLALVAFNHGEVARREDLGGCAAADGCCANTGERVSFG
jgi:hypothetical protein